MLSVLWLKTGDRAFCAVAPRLWNGPLILRTMGSVDSFKRHLETHLFGQAFNSKYSLAVITFLRYLVSNWSRFYI